MHSSSVEGLKITSVGKEGGRKRVEGMGSNILTYEVVRHFFNLTAELCWESAMRKAEFDFNSLE